MGEDLIDLERGPITSAQVRQPLAQDIPVRCEGDIAVPPVPEGDRRIALEMRAQVDEDRGILRHTELRLAWEEDNAEHLHDLWPRYRPAVRIIAQLRDDVHEDTMCLENIAFINGRC